MLELIEALQIFAKYAQPKYPTGCEHDVLHVYVGRDGFSEEDTKRLSELGFHWDDGLDCWSSFRYGSA